MSAIIASARSPARQPSVAPRSSAAEIVHGYDDRNLFELMLDLQTVGRRPTTIKFCTENRIRSRGAMNANLRAHLAAAEAVDERNKLHCQQ